MLKTYWNIIILRGHAYELPYRLWLPIFWIALDLGIVCLISLILGGGVVRDLVVEMTDLVYTAAALYFALWYYKYPPRFVQAYSAILGVGTLFLMLLASMMLAFSFNTAVGVISQVIYFWILVIYTHILKDALGITLLRAIVWIVGIEMARFLVITQILQRFT